MEADESSDEWKEAVSYKESGSWLYTAVYTCNQYDLHEFDIELRLFVFHYL